MRWPGCVTKPPRAAVPKHPPSVVVLLCWLLTPVMNTWHIHRDVFERASAHPTLSTGWGPAQQSHLLIGIQLDSPLFRVWKILFTKEIQTSRAAVRASPDGSFLRLKHKVCSGLDLDLILLPAA